jgi:hypothetical protein
MDAQTMENPLMPEGAPQAPGPEQAPGPQAAGEAASPDDLMAKYAKLQKAGQILDTSISGLVRLAELGDTIEQADVVHESGVLVAEGIDAAAMASMLAEMPEKGDLLQEWVNGHLADMAQRQAQLQFVTRAVRQEIGVASMRELMVQYAQNGG